MKIKLTIGLILAILVLDSANPINAIIADSSKCDRVALCRVPLYYSLGSAPFIGELGMRKSKTCSICGKRKILVKFYKKDSCKDGHINQCKECRKKIQKKWQLGNADKKKEMDRLYRIRNCDKIKEMDRLYRIRNSDKRKKASREWHVKNIDKVKIYAKKYREEHIEERRAYDKKRQKEDKDKLNWYYLNRRKTVPYYRIVWLLRNRIYKVLKDKGKSAPTLRLLGCSILEFKKYFKGKFTKGMTWKKFMNGEIHIDHIKPCASFDLIKESEQKKCFVYTNLQPLWAFDNISKGAKYKGKDYKKRKKKELFP